MATVAPTGSDSIKAIVVASIIGSCAVVVFTVLSVCGLLYCLYQLQGVRWCMCGGSVCGVWCAVRVGSVRICGGMM